MNGEPDTEVILRGEAIQMMNDCLNPERKPKMNDWEINFMEDLADKEKTGFWFTDKQKATIYQIWERVTLGG